jgi:hypothetical protein
MHLLQRGARQDLRAVARSSVLAELERDPPRQVLDARPQATLGPDRDREVGQGELVGREALGELSCKTDDVGLW